LPTAYFAFWRFVIVHPLFCGEIDDNNSVMHCCPSPSSMPAGAALRSKAIILLSSSQDEVTHCPLKRGEVRPMPFLWYIKYEILHSPQEVKVAH